VRYDNVRNGSGGAFGEDNQAFLTHRAQIDLSLYKAESFETHFRFINAAPWGLTSPDTNPAQRQNLTSDTGLLVNQAYAHWKITESMGMKFGRAPLHLGLGYTYGSNEWFDVPYSFDQFQVAWDWSVLKASVIAARVLDLEQAAGQTLSPDPQETHLIFHFDVKGLHEAVRSSSFSLVQVNRDAGTLDQGATVLNGLNMQRAALDMDIMAKNFFAAAFFSFVSGEEKVAQINQVAGVEQRKLNQIAYDFKVGYMFPESNKLRVWAGLHSDTGSDQPGSGDAKTYDSFYYEVYGQAGLMDFLRWGNLNFWRAGLDVELFRGFTLGAEVLSFNRSEENDLPRFGPAGQLMAQRIQAGEITLGSGTELGRELDIWADWSFESGVKIRTTLGSFFPGAVMTQATSTGSGAPSTNIFQFLTQVGYFF